MKIYTKKGDSGKTSLIGGTRVSKHHVRIEAYGTVDELNSWIGVVSDHLTENNSNELNVLKEIQDRLFTIGSSLASDPEKSKMKIPDIIPSDIELLEKEMDAINEQIPEMHSFILPGGHPTASFIHVARCVCRRAERLVVNLNENELVDENIMAYLNRLSDYLFVLSRKIIFDSGSKETPWKPRM